MPLFGPFARTRFPGAPFRVNSLFGDAFVDDFGPGGDDESGISRPSDASNGAATPPFVDVIRRREADLDFGAGATPPALGMPPVFPELGPQTTRRTQLFGPLANLPAMKESLRSPQASLPPLR